MQTVVARQLLLADLALEQGQAEAPAVAAALEQVLDSTDVGSAVDLVDCLASLTPGEGSPDPSLRSRVDALGDPHAALEERRGTWRVPSLLPHAGPKLRLVLRELGVDARIRLHRMAAGRYVDYVPVGKGGMGVVYWVRDVDLNREVALKVIHLGGGGGATDVTPVDPAGLRWPPESAEYRALSDELESRFLQEAWITGSMSHPGIAPVYELGQTEAGVPYYTMRFIEGRRTLQDAIRELIGEPLEKRLELLDAFLDVCDTMRYAHSRGVLHRDLKPSNVVLGEYGEVVVVDWGLARIEDRPDQTGDLFAQRIDAFREATDLHTVVSALGTPGYMAPEAAAGDVERITRQSDVYSLSAVLFEILTGELPIPVTNIRDYLTDVQAGKTSDVRSVSPEVPGPLALLCERGLRLDQRERLASVEELATELRRWRTEAATEREVDALTREAEAALTAARDASGKAVLPQLELASHASRRIQALRPDSLEAARFFGEIDVIRSAYVQTLEQRARRTLLRRISIAAVVLAAITAVGVSIVLERRRQEAVDARASAAASRDRAERVMTFMVEDLQDDLEPIGRLDLLTKIGSRARAYYEDQSLAGASDSGLSNRATALRRLGDAFRLRGDLPQALSTYRAASEAGAALDRRNDAGSEGTFQTSLAEARIGEVLFLQGYPTRAREILVRYQAELAGLSHARPVDTELLIARSDVAARLVSVLLSEGRHPEALGLAESALSLAERAESAGGKDDLGLHWTVLRRRLLLTAARYGPQLAQRAQELREVLSAIQELGRRAPGDVRWQSLEFSARVLLVESMRARVLRREAEEEIRRAIPVLERLVSRDPANLTWASRLASALRLHGDTLLALGQAAEAQVLFQRAYSRMRLLSDEDPSNANWLNKLTILCDRHVLTGAQLGASSATIDRWREEAVGYARKMLARDPENARHRHILAYTTHAHAGRLVARKEYAEGLERSAEAERIIVELLKSNPDNMEAAVLLASNTRLRMNAYRLSGERAQSLTVGEAPEKVIDALLKRRPDFWMLRDERISLQLEMARLLAKGTDDEERRAADLRQAIEASIRAGLAQEQVSAGARQRLQLLQAKLDALEKAESDSK